MGWFQEQIRLRMESDQEILEDSLQGMASVVMDKWHERLRQDDLMMAREAVFEILRYYHEKPPEIPPEIRDIDAQLAFALRPSGLMTRDVELEGDWFRDAYDPMLAYYEGSGKTVALMPADFGGYYYRDPDTGKKVRINRKNAGQFARDALCFYRPLPRKKLDISHLLLYMRQNISRGDVILIVLTTLLVTLVGMVVPRVYQIVTGPILDDRRISLMMGMGSFLIATAFAGAMLGVARDLLMQRISIKTSRAVESAVMMRVLSLPVSFFRRYSSGELSSRVESVNTLCDMILNNVFSVGLTSVMSLLYVTQIFRFAKALVLPSILIILLTVGLSVSAALLQIRSTRKKMTLRAKEKGASYAIIGGIQKIRLSGAEKRVFARWAKIYTQRARVEYNPPAYLKYNQVFQLAISLIGTIVLYALAIHSGVTSSEYYGFNAAYGSLMGAFTMLSGIAVTIAGIKPVLEMAEPILQEMPEVTANKTPIRDLRGNIEMSHVSFRYEKNEPYIFEDLTMNIRAGEYVAIVGRTGCGKSTLVRLLLGFEQPEKGGIFYDRSNLKSIDPRSLRRQIGVVIQNGQLFQGDVFSNISISAPEMTMQEAWEAAETAGIADDIRAMPMKMRTIISEGQGGISGGQKQRILIARAIAHKPKVLIFDEATSALDNKTQKQVSDALDELKCTRIVIAHRLSTIQHCDRILVLDQGRIAEEGSFEELVAKEGVFAELVARQRLDKKA